MTSRKPTFEVAGEDQKIIAQGGGTFLGFGRALTAEYTNRGEVPPHADDILDAWLAMGNVWPDADFERDGLPTWAVREEMHGPIQGTCRIGGQQSGCTYQHHAGQTGVPTEQYESLSLIHI